MGQCRYRKVLIVHPGAIGDCLLALPLASFMKQVLGMDQVDWIGRTEYVEFYPGRSAVDRIRSMEAIPFHRFFQDNKSFEVEDGDPLIHSFSGYEQVISFLGSENPDFEQNLLYTLHCSQSAHLVMMPPDDPVYSGPISRFYLERTAAENEMETGNWQAPAPLIVPHPNDYPAGREPIEELGINPDHPLVVIHPGSGGTQKCWAPENFVVLAAQIKEKGYEAVFLLGPAEKERFKEETWVSLGKYPVLSELSLTQVLQVLACSDGYVGNDSGISHLAACMAKPTLAVFGPTNPAKFAPVGPKVRILEVEPSVFQQPSKPLADRACELLLEIL
jgi:ADP-heptose:LPS heptosyltransferase